MGVASLYLSLLGGFAAHAPELGRIKISSRKNQALLAYLALYPERRHARERLIDLLWSGGDSDHGRNSLRQALTALRRDLAAIDPSPILVEGEILCIAPDVVIDVHEFERLAVRPDPESMKAAAALYRGDLLEDVLTGDAVFEDWLLPERTRLREAAVDLFTRLVPVLAGNEAIETAGRLVELDPLREPSQRLLITALAEDGQDELALKQCRLFSEALHRELDLAPSAALQSLQQAIAAGTFRKAKPLEAAAIAPRGRPDRPAILVLPFENRSTDPDNARICDQLADDISDALARVASFSIVAGAAARRRGADSAADYVVRGSILRVGERLRISAQVVDAVSRHHIWADQYHCTRSDLAEAQELIIKAVAASAETQIMLLPRQRLRAGQADELALEELVARGISLLYDETGDALDQALALAERAVALAPQDPGANQLLAHAFVTRVAARAVDYDPQIVARAVELARVAVALGPDNEWTHLTLSRALIEVGRLDAAIAEAERALAINPSSTVALGRLGDCFALLGRSSEALAASRHALKLDPRTPEAYRNHFTMALAHFAAGADAAAYDAAGQAARWRPDYTRAHLLIAAASAALGRSQDAQAAVGRCRARYPDLSVEGAVPRVMPPFARDTDRARLKELLRASGLPGSAP